MKESYKELDMQDKLIKVYQIKIGKAGDLIPVFGTTKEEAITLLTGLMLVDEIERMALMRQMSIKLADSLSLFRKYMYIDGTPITKKWMWAKDELRKLATTGKIGDLIFIEHNFGPTSKRKGVAFKFSYFNDYIVGFETIKDNLKEENDMLATDYKLLKSQDKLIRIYSVKIEGIDEEIITSAYNKHELISKLGVDKSNDLFSREISINLAKDILAEDKYVYVNGLDPKDFYLDDNYREYAPIIHSTIRNKLNDGISIGDVFLVEHGTYKYEFEYFFIRYDYSDDYVEGFNIINR